MADTKISGMTADTDPSMDDLVVTVNDPGGTAANRKVTLQNLFKLPMTLADDHTWYGDTITATAGENLVIGDVCYFKSDGKFWKADADAVATTAGFLAMATASINADASGVFLVKGLIRDDTWNWGTVGDELYVATGGGGNPTVTQPSGNADVIRLVGWAVHADYVWFDPDKSYFEVVA